MNTKRTATPKSKKISATTIVRMTDLGDPAGSVMTVATFTKEDYQEARTFFFNEIRRVADRRHLMVHPHEFEVAEEDGYIEIGGDHIFLVHSHKE